VIHIGGFIGKLFKEGFEFLAGAAPIGVHVQDDEFPVRGLSELAELVKGTDIVNNIVEHFSICFGF
jgi:hypothetical protein